MQKFTSTKLFKVIIISLFFAGLVFLNPEKFFNPVRSSIATAIYPFQKVFYSASVGVENLREFVASIGQLKKENEQLVKENQELLSKNAMLADSENENTMLREQLNLAPRGQFDLIPAFVVDQDPNGIGNWLEIDKGSDDGIAEGMPVIVSNGILVGRIQNVEAHVSKINLLTNPKSTVNITSLETGAKGVAKGDHGLGITFDMILQTDSIQQGNTVVTSGIGDLPRGLLVGKVQNVHPSDDHLFQQASVIYPLQVNKLEVVFVIKKEK